MLPEQGVPGHELIFAAKSIGGGGERQGRPGGWRDPKENLFESQAEERISVENKLACVFRSALRGPVA